MAKAETGVAGSVVAELAYRNDYIAVRGQSKLAEEAWQSNRCVATVPTGPETCRETPGVPAAPTPPRVKRMRVRRRDPAAAY